MGREQRDSTPTWVLPSPMQWDRRRPAIGQIEFYQQLGITAVLYQRNAPSQNGRSPQVFVNQSPLYCRWGEKSMKDSEDAFPYR